MKRLPIAVLALGLGIGVAWLHQGFRASNARLAAAVDSLKAVGAAATHRADSLAAAYHTDTVRLRVIRTQVDTMTRVVELWKRDTLRVVEYVTKADSTIRVCAAALQTCEQRVSAITQRAVAAEYQVVLLENARPSRWAPWIHRAQGLGVGVLAGTLLRR